MAHRPSARTTVPRPILKSRILSPPRRKMRYCEWFSVATYSADPAQLQVVRNSDLDGAAAPLPIGRADNVLLDLADSGFRQGFHELDQARPLVTRDAPGDEGDQRLVGHGDARAQHD